jgi:hypothetical protein
MNGSTSVSFGESGAKDAIHEYWQKRDISASEELTNVYGKLETRKPEKVAICNRTRFCFASLKIGAIIAEKNRIDRTSLAEHGLGPQKRRTTNHWGHARK